MIRDFEGFIPYGQKAPTIEEKPRGVGLYQEPQKEAYIGAFRPKIRDFEGFIPYQPRTNEPEPENKYKQIARYLLQPALGAAKRFTYPADLLNMIATGAAFDENEIQAIEREAEKSGIEFDREKYINAIREIEHNFPTQGNIERIIEEKTGLPLQPQTGLQKTLRLGSEAAAFTPGSLGRKAAAGVLTPTVKAGLQATGIPEPIAEFAALPIGVTAGSLGPKLSWKTKPSGMPSRQFEKIRKPTNITEARYDAINEKIEADFKKVFDDILKKGEGSETISELAHNPEFKGQVIQDLEGLKDVASQIKDNVPLDQLKYNMLNKVQGRSRKGLALNEYDKAYEKFVLENINELKAAEGSPAALLEQYRKNNKALEGYFEPGLSRNYNMAKRDALLDYNRAIVDTFKQRYPNSQFVNEFERLNKTWSQIKDAEFVGDFVEEMFKDAPNFKKGRQFFDNRNTSFKFEKLLGKEGYENVKQLFKDFLSVEQAHKFLKAKPTSIKETLSDLAAFFLHPAIGTAKNGWKYAKRAYQMILDKPQIAVDWRAGIDAVKKGNYEKAAGIFEDIKNEVELDIAQVPAKRGSNLPPGEEIDITPRQPTGQRKQLPYGQEKATPKEVKPEPTKPTPERPRPAEPTKPVEKPPENISEAFGQMGPGIIENLYNGLFDSLQKGKSTFAGIKDPLLAKARPYYQQGLIKSPQDLKVFATQGIEPLKQKYAPKSVVPTPKTTQALTPKQPTPKTRGRENKAQTPEKIELGQAPPKNEKFYHGTQTKFADFDKTNDIGYHFTTSPQVAEDFALNAEKPGKGHVIEAKLKINHPLELPDLVSWSPFNIAEELDKIGLKPADYPNWENIIDKHILQSKLPKDQAYQKTYNEIKDQLKKLGYDSISYENKFEGGGKSYIAFEKDQINQKAAHFKDPAAQKVAKPPQVPPTPTKPKAKEVEAKTKTKKTPAKKEPKVKTTNKEKAVKPKQEAPKSATTANIQASATNQSARPDITPQGLKKQKEYALAKIEAALKKLDINTGTEKYVHLDIPGDGQFKIINEKAPLEKAKKAFSKWPVRPGASKPKPRNIKS